jgi:rRNA maturation endonuclease Nob1
MRSFAKRGLEFYKTHFKGFIKDFRSRKICNTCHCDFSHDSAFFCPICGGQQIHNYYLYLKGVKSLKYAEDHKVDENGKAIICPRCQNEDINPNGEYCHICGVYLINICEDSDRTSNTGYNYKQSSCGTIARGNARFCIKCGNPTTFYTNGLLRDWESELKGGIQKDLAEKKTPSVITQDLYPDDDVPF